MKKNKKTELVDTTWWDVGSLIFWFGGSILFAFFCACLLGRGCVLW